MTSGSPIFGAITALIVASIAFVLVGMPTGFGWQAFAAAVAAAVITWALAMRRTLRRSRLDRDPFPESWRRVLERDVGFYRRLDDEERDRFEREVRYFVAENTITGPQAAEIDEETKVLVGASAAILIYGKPGLRYRKLRDVIVYPDAYDDDYTVSKDGRVLGQVGHQGPIILSAKALRQGFRDVDDGHNVGLHELAHVLDLADGSADGVPSLMPWNVVRPWLGQMSDEVVAIKKRRSLLRRYGATNEAEFFAVATEAFFERPRALRGRHPELYEMLRDTYGQDPAERLPKAAPRASKNERKRRRRARRRG